MKNINVRFVFRWSIVQDEWKLGTKYIKVLQVDCRTDTYTEKETKHGLTSYMFQALLQIFPEWFNIKLKVNLKK